MRKKAHLRLLVLGLLVMLLNIFGTLSAQNKTVTGTVVNKSGSPIVGALVKAIGANASTKTGNDGSFSLSVPSNVNSVAISAKEFEGETFTFGSNNTLDVSLDYSTKSLEDVVVIGYGTAKRSDLTGAVSKIGAKDFNKGILTAPDQLIQGKVAGLQIISNSGQPGGGTTVRIRGTSSVRSGNNPLYVVDGVPLDGRSGRPGIGLPGVGSSPASNPLNFINPADIASMEVLKDASSTAIYGSRGANGVIMITTKKATSSAPSVDLSITGGTSSILKRLDVLDGNEYRKALTKYGLTGGNYGANVNMLDEILRNGALTNIAIGASGGNENARIRISASTLTDNGIVKESDFKKNTFGAIGAFKFGAEKNIGVDVNLQLAQINENVVPITNDPGFEGNLIAQALQWNPTHPIKKPDGSLWTEPQFATSSINPLHFLNMYDDKVKLNNLFTSVSPYIKFAKNFEYRINYANVQSVGNRKTQVGRGLTNIPTYKDRGLASVSNGRMVTNLITHTLNYTKQLTNKLNVNATAGYEYTQFKFSGDGITAQDFQDIGIPYYNMLGFATQSSRSIFNFEDPTNEIQSFFGRGIFNIDNKYRVIATLRADGSTKFGANNKYGIFPAIGASWDLSKENFMQNLSDKVSDVRVRASWGVIGNQEYPSGASQTQFGATGIGAVSQLNVGNPNLQWEKTATTNLGVDFVLLKRVSASIDVFKRKTTDLLFQNDFPVPGGSSARTWINIPNANVVNSGVELQLNSEILRKGDLVLSFGTNLSFLKNQLNNLVGEYNTGALHGQGSTGAFVQKLKSGYPLNVYFLRAFQGIDPTTGVSKYKEDGDVSYFGRSPNPTTLLGFTINADYKKFSFVANLNGATGHHIYNNTQTSVVPINNLGSGNVASALVKSSIKEDISNPVTSSDRYLEKGNYLKLANATVSYDLGKIAKFVKTARVALTGQNLAVFTKFSGFDPEVNVDKNIGGIPSNGIEYVPYPSARRFQLTFNFGF